MDKTKWIKITIEISKICILKILMVSFYAYLTRKPLFHLKMQNKELKAVMKSIVQKCKEFWHSDLKKWTIFKNKNIN